MSGFAVRTSRGASPGPKPHSPKGCQKEKNRLNQIRAASAGDGDEKARQRRAGAARDIENNGVKANRVCQVTGRDGIRDHRSTRRLLKNLGYCHQETGHVDMPGLDLIYINQQRRRGIDQPVHDLGHHHLHLPRIPVRSAAGDRGQ